MTHGRTRAFPLVLPELDTRGSQLYYSANWQVIEERNMSGQVKDQYVCGRVPGTSYRSHVAGLGDLIELDTRGSQLYYSANWQVIEERNMSGQVKDQYVWSPVYVDAMVERDRDSNADGVTDERLAAQAG